MTLLSQDDIRTYYETTWKKCDDEAAGTEIALVNSGPVEDAVLYPLYERLLRDLKIEVDGGKVLDVGCGSGRWTRFFSRRFKPALLLGVDYTGAAVELLQRRYGQLPNIPTEFRTVDFTQPGLELGHRFDLINIMNVLFHIPEPEKFSAAMQNLARHLSPGGRVVTTEYMPRQTMRTNWMLVRSRYEFEAAALAAGLKIVDVRASCFYSNDPMGMDGPDSGPRQQFNTVRAGMNQVLNSGLNDQTRQFFVTLFSEVEASMLNFCRERIAAVDMPSQKLVVLGAAA